MNAKALAVIIFFITNFKMCQGITYDGYHLISITPRKMDHLKFLDSLGTEKYIEYKFWQKPHRIGEPVQMIVSPTDMGLFIERADHYNLDYRVLMTDLQKAFDNQSIIAYEMQRPDTFSFQHFHVLDDIHHWLTDISSNDSYSGSHASIDGQWTCFETIHDPTIRGANTRYGNHSLTNFGRYLTKGHESTQNMSNVSKYRKLVYLNDVIIEGGIHGHEWASVVFVTYLINELARAQNYFAGAWQRLAVAYDWYLIPVANPDGYEFSQRSDRLWRKNRKHIVNKSYGVDLNRNFDESWGKYSSSQNPDDDYYCGENPFSEAETKALSDFIASLKDNLKYYIAFHAYGQKIVVPYEDTVLHIENFDEMENYSRQVVRQLYLRNHVKYSTGTMYDTTGRRISGTSVSWVKKHMRARYAYTIQLRDNGTYGYALPDDELLPMCTETSTLLRDLMTARPRYVRTLYGDDANISTPDLFMTLAVYVILKLC